MKIDGILLESLSLDQIGAALQEIGDELARRGQRVAGTFAYETGYMLRQLRNRHD